MVVYSESLGEIDEERQELLLDEDFSIKTFFNRFD
jgi:hypothetical protein